jgi:hypothetical protein
MNFLERNAFFSGDGFYLKTNSPYRGWIEVYTDDNILIGIGKTFIKIIDYDFNFDDKKLDINGFNFIVHENNIEVRNLCRGREIYNTDEYGQVFLSNRFKGGWGKIYDLEKFKEFINSVLLSIRYVNDFKKNISDLKVNLENSKHDKILKKQIQYLEKGLKTLNRYKNRIINEIEHWKKQPSEPSEDIARYFIWKSKGGEYYNCDINANSISHFWFIYDEREGKLLRTQNDKYEDVLYHKLLSTERAWEYYFEAGPKNLNLGIDLARPDEPILIKGLDFTGLLPRILLYVSAGKNDTNLRYEYENVNISFKKVLELPSTTLEHDITCFCTNILLLQSDKIAEFEREYPNLIFRSDYFSFLSYFISPACKRSFDELINDFETGSHNEEAFYKQSIIYHGVSYPPAPEKTIVNLPKIKYYVWKGYRSSNKSENEKVWYIFNDSDKTLEKVFDSQSTLLLNYIKLRNTNPVEIIAAAPKNFDYNSEELADLRLLEKVKVEYFDFSGLVKKIIYFVCNPSFDNLVYAPYDIDVPPISKSILFSKVFFYPNNLSINDNIVFNENVLKIKETLFELIPDEYAAQEYHKYKKIFYTYEINPACNLSFDELFEVLFLDYHYQSPSDLEKLLWDDDWFIHGISDDVDRAFRILRKEKNRVLLLDAIRKRRDENI